MHTENVFFSQLDKSVLLRLLSFDVCLSCTGGAAVCALRALRVLPKNYIRQIEGHFAVPAVQ